MFMRISKSQSWTTYLLEDTGYYTFLFYYLLFSLSFFFFFIFFWGFLNLKELLEYNPLSSNLIEELIDYNAEICLTNSTTYFKHLIKRYRSTYLSIVCPIPSFNIFLLENGSLPLNLSGVAALIGRSWFRTWPPPSLHMWDFITSHM